MIRRAQAGHDDDAGPGLPSTFGGEVHTPTLDRITQSGIAYNRFYTTAMCSPTRASLLTGRNHHRVGNGQIAELANNWDGYSGHIPLCAGYNVFFTHIARAIGLMADLLRQGRYADG
jgi:arylsulfatase A-like enzyme